MDQDRPADEDPGADTGMFRAFAQGDEPGVPQRAVGAPFRIFTLLLGLVVFVAIVGLLLLR